MSNDSDRHLRKAADLSCTSGLDQAVRCHARVQAMWPRTAASSLRS